MDASGAVAVDVEAIHRLVELAQEHQFDVDAFLDLHAEDAIVVNFGGRRVRGKRALGEAMTAALTSPLAKVTTTTEMVKSRVVV